MDINKLDGYEFENQKKIAVSKALRYVLVVILVLLLIGTPVFSNRTQATPTWKLIGFKGRRIQDILIDPKSSNKIFVVTLKRGVYMSTDYGKNWTCVTKNLGSLWCYATAMDSFDSRILYLATSKGLFRSLNGGYKWTGVYVGPKGIPFLSLCADPVHRGVLYAGNDLYGVIKYTNFASAIDPVTSNFLDAYPSNLELHVRSIAVDPTNANRIYVGTTYNLYRSNDGGESWIEGAKGVNNQNSFMSVSSIAVNKKGNVFASIGLTTFPRPNPDDSGLFYSSNHGASWTRISSGLKRANWFPSPSISDVYFNPNNILKVFISTGTGVYHSVNGGKTWRLFGSGLPTTCLAINPSNSKVLYAGTEEGLYKYNAISTSILITLRINDPYFKINGTPKKIDKGGSKPIIKNDRTLLPIRAIIEALNGTVSWDGTERKVTINFNGITIYLWIDNPQVKVNGVEKWIDPNNHDVKPIIINGRTMLPLRFVAESLGCKVGWNGTTRTITITYQP